MAEVSPLAELLGQALYHFDRVKPLLPTYGHLLVSALFPIWIGAHASLSRPSSAAKPSKEDINPEEDTDDEEEESSPVQKMENLEASDALMFPLTAGLTLGGLYMVIKWLEDPAILNKILSFYFSQMGLFFAIAFLKDTLLVLRSFVFPRYYRRGGKLWKANQSERVFKASATDVRYSPLPGILGAIPLPNKIMAMLWTCRRVAYQRLRLRAHVRGLLNAKGLVGLLDLLSGIIALIAVGYFAFVTKPWWLTNFLGFSFCYGALQFMSPSTFWTGSLILGSLFLYDIYFVFFTPLMVTVATKLDVPIKLLFPRPTEDPDVASLAMLGLGDIVVPGMMVGLALRFDLFLYYQRKGLQKAQAEKSSEEENVKPEYQSATGAWGERFWASPVAPREPELQPPYHDARSFPKTYFKASVVGYIIGMIATLLAMQFSNHPQPALLYLVPGVLTSLWGTAWFKGAIRTMWEFSDAEEVEEDDDEKKKEEEDKSKTSAPSQKSLIMRLFSGDVKAFEPADKSSDKKTTKQANENKSDSKFDETKTSDDDQNAKKGVDDDLDLVSFSISFPSKSKKEASDTSPTPAGETDDMMAASDLSKGGNEPPAKRRRRSPKNETASS
ncbi:Peptidase A22B signal peptide peptidase [Penicillium lagena]|uniref:Peptidase A22B signal peptide peptidase n=1 Tax=Penicillium lagena TaxID=94218 RepID=UPI00253FDD59|nr:Peptidase A22B signal peptide peptidase [Penicillium lagena]KAJ5612120.1 Peptidase A22B signal peptide peptidase [Penicillium lagena]